MARTRSSSRPATRTRWRPRCGGSSKTASSPPAWPAPAAGSRARAPRTRWSPRSLPYTRNSSREPASVVRDAGLSGRRDRRRGDLVDPAADLPGPRADRGRRRLNGRHAQDCIVISGARAGRPPGSLGRLSRAQPRRGGGGRRAPVVLRRRRRALPTAPGGAPRRLRAARGHRDCELVLAPPGRHPPFPPTLQGTVPGAGPAAARDPPPELRLDDVSFRRVALRRARALRHRSCGRRGLGVLDPRHLRRTLRLPAAEAALALPLGHEKPFGESGSVGRAPPRDYGKSLAAR